MKKILLLVLMSSLSSTLLAADYKIDTRGSHAFIQFRIKHLGYSWLYGRFDNFSGMFSFDERKPLESTITVDIDVTSINSNHAERDKHLRGADFFNVKKFPKASFASSGIKFESGETVAITGDLTLKGVKKSVVIIADRIGGGADPWGGYRQGFEGSTTIKLKDFGFNFDLGAASTEAEIILSLEGVRL